MASHSDFASLLNSLTGPAADASQALQQFVPRLVGLARSRLHSRLRGKVEPEDVAQSVFRSFLTRNQQEQFDLQDWGALWAVLAVITVRKCQRRFDEFSTRKRDLQRESGSDEPLQHAASSEPNQEQAAVLSDLLEQTMNRLDARGRDILSMRLQGYSIGEISQALNSSERTVHRQLDYARSILSKLADPDGEQTSPDSSQS